MLIRDALVAGTVLQTSVDWFGYPRELWLIAGIVVVFLVAVIWVFTRPRE